MSDSNPGGGLKRTEFQFVELKFSNKKVDILRN